MNHDWKGSQQRSKNPWTCLKTSKNGTAESLVLSPWYSNGYQRGKGTRPRFWIVELGRFVTVRGGNGYPFPGSCLNRAYAGNLEFICPELERLVLSSSGQARILCKSLEFCKNFAFYFLLLSCEVCLRTKRELPGKAVRKIKRKAWKEERNFNSYSGANN